MSPRLKDIIISSVISIIITIVFGYYFLYIGYKEREPTFYIDPIRTTIIDKTNAVGTPLTLLKPNGDTITSDVISIYFYFFNQGEETIKRENVYSPITIKLEDGQILDFKTLKISRDVTGVNIVQDTLRNLLRLDFNALEKDDGFAGQVIFEGKKDARLIIEGGIDGVKSFESELSSIDPLYFVIAIGIFLIAAYVLLIADKRNPKNVPKFLFFFSALPLLYLLLVMYKSEWFIDHKVPGTLRIEQYEQQTKRQLFQLPSWFN